MHSFWILSCGLLIIPLFLYSSKDTPYVPLDYVLPEPSRHEVLLHTLLLMDIDFSFRPLLLIL
jgi:hypothetical protein